jgi:hypothetical protein
VLGLHSELGKHTCRALGCSSDDAQDAHSELGCENSECSARRLYAGEVGAQSTGWGWKKPRSLEGGGLGKELEGARERRGGQHEHELVAPQGARERWAKRDKTEGGRARVARGLKRGGTRGNPTYQISRIRRR